MLTCAATPVTHTAITREAALARVMEQRRRGRARSLPVRVARAGSGALIGIACVPLLVVLPELGLPGLLLALRLLAVEFDWAAHAFAWIAWRWGRLRAWFHAQSLGVRTLVTLAGLAIAVALIWLAVVEFTGA